MQAGVWWRDQAVPIILGGAMLWAACTGGDGKEAGPGQTGTPSCQALSEFERFRYTYDYKIESPQTQGPVDETAVGTPPFAIGPTAASLTIRQVYSGSYVRPDKYMIRIDTPSEANATALEFLFIGKQAWFNAEGQWTPADTPNPFPPLIVCESILSGVDLTGVAGSAETVAGRAASHFRLEETQLNTAAALFGAESDMGRLLKAYSVDIWLAEEGWPVRLEARSQAAYPSGREMLMEVSLEIKDVNAKDIKIEPPQ